MDFQQIQNFLVQISAINKQFDKIAELKGENFNVFEILGLSTSEVRTHSAFLAELLDCQGSHGQKGLFLKLFCEKLGIKNFLIDQSKVEVEKHVGYISQEYDEGGYIDIIITDKINQAIIIENKIYAGDQKRQLSRYFKYGKTKCSTFDVLYLTLDGKNPSDQSCEGIINKSKIINISYAVQIKEWLEQCKEKAVDHPILRETISQYIFLIRNLTGQTTNNDMKEEIVSNIVSNKENLNSFFYLQKIDLNNAVKKELILIFKQQLQDVAKDLNLKIDDSANLGFDGDTDIYFYYPNSEKGYYFDFGFSKFFTQLVYGISCNRSNIADQKDQIMNCLGQRLSGYDNWVWVANFESPYNDWSKNSEPWLAILDGTLADNIKAKIEHITKVLKDLEIKI
jgi:hypothetical protein